MTEHSHDKEQWPSDHFLRLVAAVGQFLLFGGFIFYAGTSYQRLGQVEISLGKHEIVPYHGDVGERITRLETEVANMARAVTTLVQKIDRDRYKERQE